MTQQEINQLSFWEKQVIKVYNNKKSINEFFFIDKLTPNLFRLIELKPDLSEKIREVELTPNDTDFNLRLNTLEAKMKRGEAEVLFGVGDTFVGIVRKKSIVYGIISMNQWAFVNYMNFYDYNNNKKLKKSSKEFYDLIFDKKIKLENRFNPSIENAVTTPTSTTTSTPTPTPTSQPVNQSPFQDFIDKLGFSDNCILKSNIDNFVTIIEDNAIEYGNNVQDFKFNRKTLEVINGEIKRRIVDNSNGLVAEGNLEGTAIALEKKEYEILIQKGDIIVESDGTRWELDFIKNRALRFNKVGTTYGWIPSEDEFFDRLDMKSITIEKGANVQVGVTNQPAIQSPFQDFIDKLGFSDNCIMKNTDINSSIKGNLLVIPDKGIKYGATIQDFRFERIRLYKTKGGSLEGIANDTTEGALAEANLEGVSLALHKKEYEIIIQKGDRVIFPNKTYIFNEVNQQSLNLNEEGKNTPFTIDFSDFVLFLGSGKMKIERNPNATTTQSSTATPSTQPAKQYGFKKGSVLVTTKNPLEYFAILNVDFNSGMITMESGDVGKKGSGIRIIEEAPTHPFGYMYLLQEAIDKGEYKLLYNIGDEFIVLASNEKIEVTDVIEKKTLVDWNNSTERFDTWYIIEKIVIDKSFVPLGTSANATTTAPNQPIQPSEVKVGQFYKNTVGNYYYIYATLDGNVTETVYGKNFTIKEKNYSKEDWDVIKKRIEDGNWILENPPNVPYNLGDKFYFKDLPSDVFTIDFTYTNDGIDVYNKNLKVDVVDSSGEVDNVVDLDDFKQLIDEGEVIFIKEEKAPPKQVAPAITYSSDEIRYKELKKELEQILFLKSTINDMNFEERINVDTLYEEVKSEADALFFKITEDKLGQNEIIDTMFEQSFMPLERRYDLGETNITGDNFAPNGTPSEIPESIYHITKTKDFIEWFGDYKEAYRLRNVKNAFVDCSKVVTENYEPQLVWHGSGHLFSYFLFDRFPAAYFAVNKSYAEWFANRDATRQGGYLYPFFLDIRRPLDLTLFGVDRIKGQEFLDWIYLQTGLERKDLKLNPMLLRPTAPELWAWSYLRNSPDFLAQIRDTNVFDGIIYYENNPDDIINRQENVTKAYIIFKPEQCKLAIPDRGALLQASLKSFVLKKGGKI